MNAKVNTGRKEGSLEEGMQRRRRKLGLWAWACLFLYFCFCILHLYFPFGFGQISDSGFRIRYPGIYMIHTVKNWYVINNLILSICPSAHQLISQHGERQSDISRSHAPVLNILKFVSFLNVSSYSSTSHVHTHSPWTGLNWHWLLLAIGLDGIDWFVYQFGCSISTCMLISSLLMAVC